MFASCLEASPVVSYPWQCEILWLSSSGHLWMHDLPRKMSYPSGGLFELLGCVLACSCQALQSSGSCLTWFPAVQKSLGDKACSSIWPAWVEACSGGVSFLVLLCASRGLCFHSVAQVYFYRSSLVGAMLGFGVAAAWNEWCGGGPDSQSFSSLSKASHCSQLFFFLVGFSQICIEGVVCELETKHKHWELVFMEDKHLQGIRWKRLAWLVAYLLLFTL